MTLQPGFYLVDANGNIKTKMISSKKEEIEVPVRLRTIATARDFAILVGDCAVLCVVVENFAWGE